MIFPLFFLLFCLSGCMHYSESADALVAIHIQDRNGMTETISIPEKLQNYEAVDFLASQPYKKVLRVYKGKEKSHAIITAYHPNGRLAQYLEAEGMRASGWFREWFSNGQMHIEGKVIGGTADIAPSAKKDWLFDELCQVWNEQGNIVARIPYTKGVIEGVSIAYYPSGQVQKEIPYHNSLEEGEGIEYYPTGVVRIKQSYAKGQKNGMSTGYFENGDVAWSEEYTEGRVLHGSYYNAKGDLISQVRDGRGQQAIYQNNYPTYLVELHQGNAEGLVQQFGQEGDLLATYSLKNSKKQGEEINYYLPSETTEKKRLPKLSVQWDKDLIHGIVKTWYPNGQLQSQREYCRNEKLGPSCAWYRNGSLMLVEEYEEGKLLKGAYYKKNQKEPISTIVNGNGLATLYDDEGGFLRKVSYGKGKPIDPED
ncbi:MAG: hypothetical protein KGI80_00500 [Verrucomicrobiota bacterium]|nr:hypothetical protein [Verrucomicrobiota bacterium]